MIKIVWKYSRTVWIALIGVKIKIMKIQTCITITLSRKLLKYTTRVSHSYKTPGYKKGLLKSKEHDYNKKTYYHGTPNGR